MGGQVWYTYLNPSIVDVVGLQLTFLLGYYIALDLAHTTRDHYRRDCYVSTIRTDITYTYHQLRLPGGGGPFVVRNY